MTPPLTHIQTVAGRGDPRSGPWRLCAAAS